MQSISLIPPKTHLNPWGCVEWEDHEETVPYVSEACIRMWNVHDLNRSPTAQLISTGASQAQFKNYVLHYL